jgi:hypothetical protein
MQAGGGISTLFAMMITSTPFHKKALDFLDVSLTI